MLQYAVIILLISTAINAVIKTAGCPPRLIVAYALVWGVSAGMYTMWLSLKPVSDVSALASGTVMTAVIAESIIIMASCFAICRGTSGCMLKALSCYPGFMVGVSFMAMATVAVKGFPGVPFGRIALCFGLAVAVVMALLPMAVKRILPFDADRLRIQYSMTGIVVLLAIVISGAVKI